MIPHPASFRDPAGFMFHHEGILYRQVNVSHRLHYDTLMSSGLYQTLVAKQWLVAHTEMASTTRFSDAYKILRPTVIPFISYPYEWSFSQLKDAALRTVAIQLLALEHDMTLKDASAYNIQFVQGAPQLIDTLSFECYQEGKAWAAYKQFCQHFVAPLALMASADRRLLQLLKIHIDGIPLDLASRLLPKRSWLNSGLLMHIHLHALMQKSYSNTTSSIQRKTQLSKRGLMGILMSLRRTLNQLVWRPPNTVWGNYYQDIHYSASAFEHKRCVVQRYLGKVRPKLVWDFGANTGYFSRLANEIGAMTVAFDMDESAIDTHYRTLKEHQVQTVLPLLLDLTNPSPSLGWHHSERSSLVDRGPVDCVMVLALVHHLVFTHHIPLAHLAAFFASISRCLMIEFVPQTDPQVQRLLQSSTRTFVSYTQAYFENVFNRFFSIDCQDVIQESGRVMYLMTILETH